MKLDEILDKIDEDAVIDKTALDSEALRIPKLHSKYLKIYAEEKRVLNRLKSQLTVMIHEKVLYYSGKASAEVYKERPFHHKLLKGDIEKYCEADPDIVKLTDGITVQEEKIEVLQEFIKSINSRGYQIKSAIDFLKWSSGN